MIRIPALLLFFLPLILPAQPYKLDLKREAWIGGAGLVFLAADLGLSTALEPLRAQDIAALDPAAVWGPDRSALKRYSMAADLRSDVALAVSATAAGVSGLLALDGKPFQREGVVLGVLWLETNVLAIGGTLFCKDAVHRARPFVYNTAVPLGPKLEKDARRSFFSGHTSLAAANTFFAAKVFSDYFPESPWKPMVWGLAAALPAWTGLERYLAGKHFPSDALAGYGFGALCGWLIPHLHRSAGDPSSLQILPFSGNESAGVSLLLEF